MEDSGRQGIEQYQLKEDQFQFQLVPVKGEDSEGEAIPADEVPMPTGEDGSTISQPKGNDAAGVVNFDEVAYTEADTGNTYWYAATEIVPDDATKKLEDGTVLTYADATPEQRATGGFAKGGITYSGAVFGYKVTIEDIYGKGILGITQTRVAMDPMDRDAEGNLVPGDATDALPVFLNELQPGGFTVAKQVEGENPNPNQEFTFRIKLKGDDVDPNAIYDYDLVRVGSVDDPATQQGKRNSLPAPLQFFVDLFKPTKAYADIVGWTEYTRNDSSVRWMIDDEGVLHIEPLEGTSGVLNYNNSTNSLYVEAPWSTNSADIVSIVVPDGCTIVCKGSAANMFRGLSITSFDSRGFDFSEVTNMIWMFSFCHNLETIELHDLSLVNNTSMEQMFRGSDNLKSVSITGLNAPNITNISWMFQDCTALETAVLKDWDVPKITNLNNLFFNCTSLSSAEIDNIKSDELTSMWGLFQNCSSLVQIKLTNLDTSMVTNMASMFANCSSLGDQIPQIDTSSVTVMNSMFYGCTSLTSPDLSYFDTTNVTLMNDMFNGCTSLENPNLSSFVTSNVTRMDSMFEGCSNLKSINLSNFDTSNVLTMEDMFLNCTSLEYLDISSFKPASGSGSNHGIQNMLRNASALKHIVLGPDWSFNGSYNSNLTNPSGTFYTRRWIHVDEQGTPIDGQPSLTTDELKRQYNGSDEQVGHWVWQKKSIKLHFEPNGGEGVMDDFFITEYEFSLPANTFTKDMAEFRFWSTDPNTNYISHSNQNYSYIDQDPVILLDGGVANYLRLKSSIDTTTGTPYLGSVLGWTFDAEIEKTLYAQWAYNKYKVVFEPGSEQAAGSMQEYVVPYSESFKIPDPSYYWFKHKVTGWNAKLPINMGKVITQGK